MSQHIASNAHGVKENERCYHGMYRRITASGAIEYNPVPPANRLKSLYFHFGRIGHGNIHGNIRQIWGWDHNAIHFSTQASQIEMSEPSLRHSINGNSESAPLHFEQITGLGESGLLQARSIQKSGRKWNFVVMFTLPLPFSTFRHAPHSR